MPGNRRLILPRAISLLACAFNDFCVDLKVVGGRIYSALARHNETCSLTKVKFQYFTNVPLFFLPSDKMRETGESKEVVLPAEPAQ
jgi:hypothetical protein